MQSARPLYPQKADINRGEHHVCFVPIAGIGRRFCVYILSYPRPLQSRPGVASPKAKEP
jgi:hypothetical protein